MYLPILSAWKLLEGKRFLVVFVCFTWFVFLIDKYKINVFFLFVSENMATECCPSKVRKKKTSVSSKAYKIKCGHKNRHDERQ